MLRLAIALLALASTTAFAQNTKVHWYGQAAFRIETPSGGVILIDPWLKAPTNPDKASLEKLGRVDYILVTHGHWDHIQAVTAMRDAGIDVGISEADAAMLPAYDFVIPDDDARDLRTVSDVVEKIRPLVEARAS